MNQATPEQHYNSHSVPINAQCSNLKQDNLELVGLNLSS